MSLTMNLLEIIIVGSVVIDLLPVRFSTFARYYRRNRSTVGQCIGHL